MLSVAIPVAWPSPNDHAAALPATGPNVLVEGGPAHVDGAAMAVDASGDLHLTWKENLTSYSGAYYSRSSDGGLTWRPAIEVDPPYSGDVFSVSIAVEREAVPSRGRISVVYEQKTTPLADAVQIWLVTSNDGVTWSTPRRVDGAPPKSRATAPAVAASDGRTWVAWTNWRLSSEPHTYLRGSDDGGLTWGPEVDLSETATPGLFPAIDAKGNTVAVAWRLPAPPAIASARTDDAGATWTRTLAARGAKSYESLNEPDVFLDDLGVEHLVWAHEGYTLVGLNYVGWGRVSYAWSGDGATWSAPVRVDDGTAPETRVSSTTIGGLAGTLWVGWEDNRTGTSHIYASWSRDGRRWGDGVLNTNDLRVDDMGASAAQQTAPVLRTGGYGVYAAWQDYRGDPRGDVYASPIQASPLAITEIQDEPAAEARVEIYNAGRVPYSLAGAILYAGATTVGLASLGSVPARGYVVIGASADADLRVPLSMGTEGASVWIGRGTDLLASAGSGSFGIAPDPLPGESTARFAGSLDYVGPWTRSVTRSFHARNAAPPPNLAPILVLNEVLWNPVTPSDRFAEVHYRGGGTLSLAGYTLVADTAWTFPSGLVSGASRHSVVGVLQAGAMFDSLAAGADNLYLYDPAGRLLDMVGWTSPHTPGRTAARAFDGVGGNTGYDDASSIANGWEFDRAAAPNWLELGPAAEAFGDLGSTVEFALQATSHATSSDYVNVLPAQAPGWSVRYLHTDRTPLTDSPGDADGVPDLGLLAQDTSVWFLVAVTMNPGGPADGGTVTVPIAFAALPWTGTVALRASIHPYLTVDRTVSPSTVYVAGSGPPYNELAGVTVTAKASGTAVPITAYRDIVFVVDDNSSMNFLDRMNLRTEAVKGYIELMRPQDRASLEGYHLLPWISSNRPLTNGTTGGKGVLEDDADTLACSPFCYSALLPDYFAYRRIDRALEKATEWLDRYGDPRNLRMVVLLAGGPCWPACTNITTAIQNAARKGIAIYTVGLGRDLDEPLLRSMAGATGGRYYRAIIPRELAGIYKSLGALRDDTAARDPDPSDATPLIEDVLPPTIFARSGSFVDPATGAPRDPDSVVHLADRTLLRWNVAKIAVGATWSVRYDVSSSRTGTVDVAMYPDSRLAFVDWKGTGTTMPIPGATITVLRTPTPPYVFATIPSSGAGIVPLGTYIEATFSEAMDAPTVRWIITPATAVTPWWAAPNMLYLNHTGLRECQTYTVEITEGLDLQGEALATGTAHDPWSFSTVCTPPYVVRTSPAHNDASVPLDAPIVVTFSERMDPAITTAAISPTITLTGAWNANGDVLTFTHTDPFLECSVYTVTASGKDLSDTTLASGLVPNPWSFLTVCPPKVRYTITRDPAVGIVILNGAQWAVPADVLLRPGDALRIEAPEFDARGTSRLAFAGWSDGGARDHTIIAGDPDVTITATYRLQHPVSLTLAGLDVGRPATITFTVSGSPDSATTSNAWSSWADDGSALAVDETVAGGMGERWSTLDATRWTVTAQFDATVAYVHQYAASVTANGLTGMSAAIDFDAWGVAQRGSAVPAWSGWVDADTTVSTPDTIAVGSRERYRTRDATSWIADRPLAVVVGFVHQFQPRVTLPGTDGDHTVGATWVLDGSASRATSLSREWLDWADAGTSVRFDDRTSGDVPRTAIDPTSLTVDRGLDATIRYAASPPPIPSPSVANWKPFLSLVYGILLLAIGTASGAKEDGRWRRLRIPLAVAAPELAIGLLSWGTGVFRIPEGDAWLSLGLWADSAVLGAGLAVLGILHRRRTRSTGTHRGKSGNPGARGPRRARPRGRRAAGNR